MRIETDREEDGRWIAEVPELPGVVVYGKTREEAINRVEALALRVIADRLDHVKPFPNLTSCLLSQHDPVAFFQSTPGVCCFTSHRLVA